MFFQTSTQERVLAAMPEENHEGNNGTRQNIFCDLLWALLDTVVVAASLKQAPWQAATHQQSKHLLVEIEASVHQGTSSLKREEVRVSLIRAQIGVRF